MQALQKAPSSVLAGSILNWGVALEDSFSLIVFLTVPADIRVARLREREIQRFGGGGSCPGSPSTDVYGRYSVLGTGGMTTNFVLDGSDEIAEIDGTNRRSSTPLHSGPLGRQRIAVAEGSDTSAPTLTFFHVNHQGSVMAMTDLNGNATNCAIGVNCQSLSYNEFGSPPTPRAQELLTVLRTQTRHRNGHVLQPRATTAPFSAGLCNSTQLDRGITRISMPMQGMIQSMPPDPNGTTTVCWQLFVGAEPVGLPFNCFRPKLDNFFPVNPWDGGASEVGQADIRQHQSSGSHSSGKTTCWRYTSAGAGGQRRQA